ncbi:MAG: hypothetical protein NDI75_09140 [Candidatus Didemnitutus sp.]|nr:hypothetical protein [Candidatus Didemnitutus sp.]
MNINFRSLTLLGPPPRPARSRLSVGQAREKLLPIDGGVRFSVIVVLASPETSILSIDLKAALFTFAGFVLNQLWSAFRSRRIAVPWTATFQKVNPQFPLVTGGNVEVLVGKVPCKNLVSCQVQLWNESSRDIEKLDVLFTFNEPFQFIESHGGLVCSAKSSLFSDGFQRTIKVVANLPEAERSKHSSYPYLMRNREFHLPSLNRGDSAKFSFWVNADDEKAIPEVTVTTEKSGVRLVSRKANFQPLDVNVLKVAIPVGILVATCATIGVAQLGLSTMALALTSCAIGAGTGLIGLLVLFIVRVLKRLI